MINIITMMTIDDGDESKEKMQATTKMAEIATSFEMLTTIGGVRP